MELLTSKHRSAVVSNTARLFAENANIELTERVKEQVNYIFELVERRDGWIQSPRHNRTDQYWSIVKTEDGKIMRDSEGMIEFGMLVDKKGKNCVEIIDTLFSVKRENDLSKVYAALANSPLFCTL